ncbi:MAG: 4Fe-4S binding protein [Candidatus Poribacteria bacterium]|nr:4Fe-4S binding protein [Candidatus Poribacteria bacterium]
MDKYIRNIYKGVYTVLVGMRVTIRQFFEPNVTHQYPYEHDFEKKQNVREIPKGYRGQLYNRIEDCIGCKKCELICPVDCITITGDKLPKGEQLWDSMNVVHLKDGREVIGIIEGDDKKIMSEDSMIITNITTRLGPQEVIDRLEASEDESRTETFSTEDISRVVTRNPVVFYLDQFDIDMSLCMYCGLCTEVCPTQCLVMKDSLEGIEYSSFDRTDLIFEFDKQEMYDKDETDNTEAAD